MTDPALLTDEEWRRDLRARQVAELEQLRAKLDSGEPVYYVHRCPVCLRQKPSPRTHTVAGDDMCQGIGPDGTFHSKRLERIMVRPA